MFDCNGVYSTLTGHTQQCYRFQQQTSRLGGGCTSGDLICACPYPRLPLVHCAVFASCPVKDNIESCIAENCTTLTFGLNVPKDGPCHDPNWPTYCSWCDRSRDPFCQHTYEWCCPQWWRCYGIGLCSTVFDANFACPKLRVTAENLELNGTARSSGQAKLASKTVPVFQMFRQR